MMKSRSPSDAGSGLVMSCLSVARFLSFSSAVSQAGTPRMKLSSTSTEIGALPAFTRFQCSAPCTR
jgi:hypothetical protein